MKKRVIAHLKGDIKDFKKEASEDRKLIKALKHEKHEKKESKKHEKAEHKKKHVKKRPMKKSVKKKHHSKSEKTTKAKFKKVMHEFGEHKLHSGSKKGPEVTNPKQAVAIAYSEARKAKKK